MHAVNLIKSNDYKKMGSCFKNWLMNEKCFEFLYYLVFCNKNHTLKFQPSFVDFNSTTKTGASTCNKYIWIIALFCKSIELRKLREVMQILQQLACKWIFSLNSIVLFILHALIFKVQLWMYVILCELCNNEK